MEKENCMSTTTVPCTSCNNPRIPVFTLIYRIPSAEFPRGSYEGKCPKCGAKFAYDADYIKSINK